jgi:hypothetical protein
MTSSDNPIEDGRLMQQFFGRRGINTTWVPVRFYNKKSYIFHVEVEVILMKMLK